MLHNQNLGRSGTHVCENPQKFQKLNENSTLSDDNVLKSNSTNELNNIKSIKKENKLFVKVLIFQFIVSGFVFFILFLLKITMPFKFNAISMQLKKVFNNGPKFYDSVNSVIDKAKKLNVNDVFMNSKKNDSLIDKKKTLISDNKNEFEASNLKLEPVSRDVVLKNEQLVDDNLETISADDGDVLFANFVPPIVNSKGRVSSKFGARINPITKKTGDVTGAHMHFGVRKDGNWLDPKYLFPYYG